MYYFTGIQHTKTGDVAIPTITYTKRDEYLAKYHHEMNYAMSSDDFLGLTVLVFDNVGFIVLSDNWAKEATE